LGYAPPKATAAREFLERFHDKVLEKLRLAEQKSFIFPASGPVSALQAVQAGCVRRIAQLYEERGQRQTIATIDQDATIIESHKRAALFHYEGGRGYQPMVAVWAELDLAVADEFRDGNVPAKQAPLMCAQMAFAALPASVGQRYFRGDSACHERDLLGWLKHPDRAKEPGGRIGFGVSAVMSPALGGVLRKVKEREWKTFGTEEDGTLRQWAEVDFVPGERASSSARLRLVMRQTVSVVTFCLRRMRRTRLALQALRQACDLSRLSLHWGRIGSPGLLALPINSARRVPRPLSCHRDRAG
jgi:hypothetical protein